jgi:acyl carrier protein
MPAMTPDAIRDAVNTAIAKEFEIEPERLVPAAELVKDLELDSLDSVDLIAAMEKTFKVKCPEKEARALRTMGDIYAFVDRLMNQPEVATAPQAASAAPAAG